MTEQLTIRQETPNDFNDVYEVNQLAFGQDHEAKLVVRLRRNPTVFIPELSLVAVADDVLVGHIMFTKINIISADQCRTESLALAPMAVLPAFQQKGIGSKLINHGLAKARELQYKSVIVLGHEHYYPKFGFTSADNWNIKAPFDVPSEVFMALELTTDALLGIEGIVEYPEEFQEV